MQVYIALISLHQTIRLKRLGLRNMPGYIVHHGFDGLEILDRQLADADAQELELLRRACAAHACGIVIDASSDLTHSAPDRIQAEVDALQEVVRKAALLHCNVVRITLGGQTLSFQKVYRGMRRGRTSAAQRGGMVKSLLSSSWLRRFGFTARARLSNHARLNQNKSRRAVELLDQVLPYAARHGISLAIENHWGISSRPEWILRIIDDLDHLNIGTCPDFGNFPGNVDRYAAITQLAPKALHVQAKCWNFDANGEERTINYKRCMDALGNAGYDNTIAIEYEGGGDEMAACSRARELIHRYAHPV